MREFRMPVSPKGIVSALAIVLLALVVWKVRPIVTTFAISFFIAYLINPPVRKLENKGVPRTLSIVILFLLLTLVVALALAAIIPALYDDIRYLGRVLPGYAGRAMQLVQELADTLHLDISVAGLKEMILPRVGQISQYAAKGFSGILNSLGSMVSLVLNVSLVPILVFYFLKDFGEITHETLDFIGEKFGRDIKDYFSRFNSILSRYLRGQFIVALILGVLYTVALVLAGVKPALLLGLTSGLLNIVPYLGFLFGFTSALILAFLQYGDLWHPLYVVIGFTVVQALEGNVITPKIVGDTLGLHPLAVIFSLMAGGYIMGIAGMIIALPVAAFLAVVLTDAADELMAGDDGNAAEGS